jgi:hypothetical protein
MGFLKSVFGSSDDRPPTNPARETLFGDLVLERWPPPTTAVPEFPWTAFVSARSHLAAAEPDDAVECWRAVLARPGLDARHYLQAWHFLREQGHSPTPDVAKQVLGIVVEITTRKGLDLLAAYSDHSARYYTYSGGGMVWEHPDESLNFLIDELLTASKQIVNRIGPWEQARLPAPPRGHARMSFLTPSGLHFGEGPVKDLTQDPTASQVLQLATALTAALVGKTKNRR